MRGGSFWLAQLIAVILLGTGVPTLAVHADAPPGPVVYDDATGHNIREPFLSFWYAHGDADVIGSPLTEAMPEGDVTVQYFQNARLDLRADGTVVPGPLGREASGGKMDGPFAPGDHHAANGFKRYWDMHDGAALLGPAISDEIGQEGGTVQFFARGALLWRASRADKADDIILLPLGRGAFDARQYPAEWLGRAPSQASASVAFHVPVLMYHHIGPAARYFTTGQQFAAEMDWLQRNGYHTVTIAQLYQAMFGGRTLPAKPVALTFDDANGDQTAAFPILQQRGMVATYFVISSKRELSDAQLVNLIRSGNEVESHTINHPFLTKTADGQMANELHNSKADLEARLGWPVRYIAYPYGDSNGRVWSAAQVAGYRGGINATGGNSWEPGKQFWEPRIEIGGTIGMDGFTGYAARQ